jgi:hypothetical protein
MHRDLQSELLQYIPQDKKEGDWDFEKDGKPELDPNSLPPNLAHNEDAKDKEGNFILDGKGEPYNIAGIRVNELAAYNYAANVQQQQAINDLNKTVEEQGKKINELEKRVKELEDKVFGGG